MTGTDDSSEPEAIVAAVSPAVGRALAFFRSGLYRDGALSVADKASFIAAGHASVLQAPLTRRELQRCADLGVPAERISAVALALLHVRGEAAFRDFVGAAEGAYELAQPDTDLSMTPESADEYFADQFGGELPPRQALLSGLLPEQFAAYAAMHRGTLGESSLPTRTRELLLCTVLAAAMQFTLLEAHVIGARGAGAAEVEIAEALLCAVPAAGASTWAGASAVLLATRGH